MTFHQAISLFVLLYSSYFFVARYSTDKALFIKRSTLACQLISLGVTGSILAGFLNNFYYHGKIIPGENYWGALVFTLLFVPYLFNTVEDKILVFNQIAKYALTGTILVKIGCAVSHVGCYGAETRLYPGIIDRHPLPLYEAAFHLAFLLLFFKAKEKFSRYLGVVWLIFMVSVAFIIDSMKVYPFRDFISLPQLVYLLLYLAIYRVYLFLYLPRKYG